MGNHKTALTIGILLVILLSFPILLFTLRSNQDTRQHADEVAVSADTVATVGGETIKESDVNTVAKQTYDPSTLDADSLNKIRDQLVERKILDQEAKSLGITITNADIHDALTQVSTPSAAIIQQTKYLLMKDEIIKKSVESREAYVIGAWVPPLSYPQQSTFPKLRTDVANMLQDVKARFDEKDTPLDVAKTMVTSYPSLKNLIGLNGYPVIRTDDETVFTSPRVYTFTSKNKSEPLNAAMLQMKDGEVKIVNGNDNSGGSVIWLIKSTHAVAQDYPTWLANAKKNKVKVYKSL